MPTAVQAIPSTLPAIPSEKRPAGKSVRALIHPGSLHGTPFVDQQSLAEGASMRMVSAPIKYFDTHIPALVGRRNIKVACNRLVDDKMVHAQYPIGVAGEMYIYFCMCICRRY